MEGPQCVAGTRAGVPRILEPPGADLAVGPACDPALGLVAGAELAVGGEIAVVAEGEPAARIGEGLGIGQLEGRELRGASQMDEEARRLDRAEVGDRRIVAEGADVAMAVEHPLARQPGNAPAEAGHPVPLEPVGEGPQLVEAERLGGSGDEVLAHRRR